MTKPDSPSHRCWPWSHDWTRWQTYEVEYENTPLGAIYPPEVRGKTFKSSGVRQRHTCNRCGRTQDETVR